MRMIPFFIAACLLLIGCDPAAITDLPLNPRRLVIQSQPELGKPWEVYVTHTLPLLDTMTSYIFLPQVVPNATVKLFDGDTFVEDLVATGPDSVMQKFVGSATGPVIGHTYSIKAAAPGYESVTARYVQPPAVNIDEVKMDLLRFEVFNMNAGTPQAQLEFNIDVTFTDPPGDNYYYIALLHADSPNLSTAKTIVGEYMYSRLADYQSQYNEGGAFLDDKKFAGKKATLSFRTFMGPVLKADTLEMPYFFISLRNLSKELYDYRAFVINPAPFYYDPYAQPPIVKSNVENGLGVFAGFTADSKGHYFQVP